MKIKKFLLRWSIVGALSALAIWGLLKVELFASFALFSWICLAFFALSNLILFFVARRAALSPNKNTFTNILMGITFIKLIISGAVVVLYNQMAVPESKFFLVPFFGLYMVYTAFEVAFLMEIGNK